MLERVETTESERKDTGYKGNTPAADIFTAPGRGAVTTDKL